MVDTLFHREFLNEPGHYGNAYVAYIVDADGRWSSGSFEIMDCYRKATLDFPLDDDEATEHSLRKLDRLLTALHTFKMALKIEAEAAHAERQKAAETTED